MTVRSIQTYKTWTIMLPSATLLAFHGIVDGVFFALLSNLLFKLKMIYMWLIDIDWVIFPVKISTNVAWKKKGQLFLEKGVFQQFTITFRKIIFRKMSFLTKIFFLEIVLVSSINDTGRVWSDNEQIMKNGQKTNTESFQPWIAF